MTVPVFSEHHVLGALTPSDAVDTVRTAFEEHARGRWAMPSKVYVEEPDGDFRAMPATGGGYAVLKWVTSFPANPEHGLPTVSGVALLSDAHTGMLRAVFAAGAVTALRTGAAAVLAAETLARQSATTAAVVGCGVNGRAAARTFTTRGRDVLLFDVRPEQAHAAAQALGPGAQVADSLEQALGCDIVVTVTPGHRLVVENGSLRPGQHVSLMGADGPGKAEIALAELLRTRIVCDEWTQASHHGDIAQAVVAGHLERSSVAELGRVLIGEEPGRRSDEEITVFDSTGLAVQDLAVTRAVYERYRAASDSPLFASVVEVEL